MAIVLGALGTFLYVRLGRELLASIDMGLRSRAEVISNAIGRGGPVGDSSGDLIDPDEAFAQVLDATGPTLVLDASSGVASKAPLVPADQLPSIARPTFLDRSVPGLEEPARLLVVPLADGERYAVVGATLSDRREALDRLLILLAIGGPIALLLSSTAGWALAGAALRPVERMRAEASAISASEPERRLAVPPAEDELSRLASTLNGMLGRLHEALQRERRFVDDASHELRTPLSVLKAELDLALSRSRTGEELEAALRSASAETDRLARLAEDLLVLSRAEGGRLPVHRVEVSLADVIEESCAGARSRADGVRLRVAVPGVEVGLDPVRLRQALENLLDNALRNVPPGGEVAVDVTREDGLVRIVVQDSGPGFPAGYLPRAFEPFTRADTRGGGAGLGLAIVRAIAEGHGGTATAENKPEGGARVTLTLRA
jgi:signal transduction histidine kinase